MKNRNLLKNSRHKLQKDVYLFIICFSLVFFLHVIVVLAYIYKVSLQVVSWHIIFLCRYLAILIFFFFWFSLRTHLSWKMTPKDLGNIYTTRKFKGHTSMCNITLELSQYFYLLMEKLLGHYYQVWSPYYQAAQCNQKKPIPLSSCQVTGQV